MSTQNLIMCPDCDKEVSRRAEACPNCGRPIKPRQTAMGLLAAVVIGLIFCWLLLTFVVPYLNPH